MTNNIEELLQLTKENKPSRGDDGRRVLTRTMPAGLKVSASVGEMVIPNTCVSNYGSTLA